MQVAATYMDPLQFSGKGVGLLLGCLDEPRPSGCKRYLSTAVAPRPEIPRLYHKGLRRGSGLYRVTSFCCYVFQACCEAHGGVLGRYAVHAGISRISRIRVKELAASGYLAY